MLVSNALITVENPHRYITRLCRHWAHKYKIEQSEHSGTIDFGHSQCTLVATENELKLHLTSRQPEDFNKMQQVVTNHLVGMSNKNIASVNWE